MAANPLGEEKSPAAGRGVTPARAAVIAALAAAVIVLAIVFLGSGGGHKYTLIFQNASQLVPDNQVLIGGSPVGSVESIGLSDDNLAEVHVEVSQQLHEGTTAVIRATSLSGVANHYVSVSPGPNSNPPLDDGAELGLAATTTPIDIDQFFNTFPPPVRRGLSDFIRGNAAIYAGQGEAANRAYKYFGPALNRTDAFVKELNADQRLFSRFIVSSSKLTTAIAQRGEALSSAISNASTAFGAIASQNVALDRTLRRLPPTMRQANTTFVNLRAALDDLDPLVETAKPATKNLAPFLAELRPIFSKLVPFTRNLRLTVSKPGQGNDAGELLALLPTVQRLVSKDVPPRRRIDRRLPAEPQLRPRLRARPPQRPRQARPDHRLLRRQRPLRPRRHGRPEPLRLQRRHPGTDQKEPAVRRLRHLGPLPAALPRRRDPDGARRLQPLRQPALRGEQRQLLRMQPGRRPPRTMIKRLIVALGLVAAAVAVVLLLSGGSGSGNYMVRAIFDNGAFMVNGEQVRVAGANVGTIESVGVTMPGDTVAYRHGKAVSVPGKAVIVMNITDPGFQDFRSDASCLIRPQSLIGEKFVDCRPTLPRAPGTPPPPALRKIPSGQAGAGQYLLPLGNNSTSVDPDLINDIQSLPYAQRFRLILNELGSGLAGRGKDIEVLVKRANPVLRDADRVFGILSAQRDRLAQLASDSETILGPLSRERAHVAGFFTNAGAAAQVNAENGTDVEASLRKLPRFLQEFRQTMRSLKGFSDAAAPVFADLGKAAPSFTDATRTLTPFSEATTVALKSLGTAGEESGPLFREADPIVRKAAAVAKSGVTPTNELSRLFTSIKKTGGWDALVELIYNTTATFNGFDQFGHFGRTLVTLTNCVDYEPRRAGASGCVARFTGPNANESSPPGAGASEASLSAFLYRRLERELVARGGGVAAGTGPAIGVGQAGTAGGGPAVALSGAVGR